MDEKKTIKISLNKQHQNQIEAQNLLPDDKMVQALSENNENQTPAQTKQTSNKRKFSVFQIVSALLFALLLVAIVVQIGIIVSLKNKTDDLQNKLDKLPSQTAQIDVL